MMLYTYTSDLIIRSLEMFHVHSSCISKIKNIKGNIWSKEESVVNRVEPESNE